MCIQNEYEIEKIPFWGELQIPSFWENQKSAPSGDGF